MDYQLKIYLKSPVCIAKHKSVGNMIETIDFIPGSAIRGALAMCFLEKHGLWDNRKRIYNLTEEKQNEFYTLFHSDNLCFHNAYIKGHRVIPLTASTCKYQGGFFLNIGRNKQHGVQDTLFEYAKYELTGLIDKEALDECKACKAPMERFGGYYKRKQGAFGQGVISKRLITRTAVNDSLETSASGKLYTLEVLNENQTFIAELNRELFDRLEPHFENITVRIGRARSRGLGEVEVTRQKTLETEEYSISRRFENFNENFQKFMKNKLFFSITLLSDVIVIDELLRFKFTVEICDLVESAGGLSLTEIAVLNKFKLIRGCHLTHIVSGWNQAIKMPQEDVLAISKGSVFLYMAGDFPVEEKNHLCAILNKIESAGIGEQKNCGYGKIRVCDEFHWEGLLK